MFERESMLGAGLFLQFSVQEATLKKASKQTDQDNIQPLRQSETSLTHCLPLSTSLTFPEPL